MIQTLKGFRDFLPDDKRKRDWVIQKVSSVFQRFGFEPIETPTLEYADLILGKYGAEADKLVYHFKDRGERDIALRYDQTVPTARVLAQHQNSDILPKLLRRYQIQNVFRADKPQKGRYREFTQCDCDIFASDHYLADAEILAVFYEAYKTLGIKTISIKINDRATLIDTLQTYATKNISVFSIIQSIDKLDKTEATEVVAELVAKGLVKKSAEEVLGKIQNAHASENLQRIRKTAIQLGVPEKALQFSPTLARGLDYYTGLIFEGNIPEYTVGSVGGGGRYDNLINDLCNVPIPAVGFALGFDRIVEALDELNLFPQNVHEASSKVLVSVFEETLENSLHVATLLREEKISTEIFPQTTKLDKQLKYADKKGIPFVVIVGQEEVKNNTVTVKNMKTGTQQTVALDQLVESF